MEEPRIRRRYLETILGVPFVEGNKVDVLVNGDGIFPPMLHAIRQSKVSIQMLTYVYWTGRIANEFADALAERAEKGVKVRVLLDAFGAARMPEKLLKRLKTAGAEVEWFRPIKRMRLHQLDNRTHRKVLVCDNWVGFTGGVGIAQEWEGNARNKDEWRETHLRLEGPCVAGLLGAFWDDWFQARGYGDMPEEQLSEAEGTPGNTPVQIIRSNAMGEGSENAALISGLIKIARKRLDITTAYFVPTDLFLAKLCAKAKSGTRVRIILPGDHTDHRFDQLAGEDIFENLLEAGVEIYRYQKTMLHAKVLLVDDDLAMVGSTNFNQRSIQKDDEVSAVISDPGIVGRLDELLTEDLSNSERVTKWKWRKRGILQRAGETVTKPFKPQL